MQELRWYLDCGQPELSTTKPPTHPKTAKDKSFLGTPQRKIGPALQVNPLNPEAQYYSAFLWCLCALVVRLKCFGLVGAEARGADEVFEGVGHHKVLASEGFRSGTPARNLPGHFQDQVKIPPGLD